MIYALDTNIIIDFFRLEPNVIKKRNEAVLARIHFVIPPIVDYEIRRGFYKFPKEHIEIYQDLARNCHVGEMTPSVMRQSMDVWANLRRKGFTVGDADIFIAAFCIVNDYVLITNDKDFVNIENLNIIDWN